MSDIDLAINASKRLESLLEERLGASGKGLHEKVSSVEARLPRELVRNLRLVATVRNKIVHESDYQKIDDRAAFVHAAREAEHQLRAFGRKKTVSLTPWIVLLAIIGLAAAAAAFLYLHGWH